MDMVADPVFSAAMCQPFFHQPLSNRQSTFTKRLRPLIRVVGYSVPHRDNNIELMSKQDDNEFLTKRKQLAHQLLREIVEFAEFEKWQVPYEFLTTMEGLAAIVN